MTDEARERRILHIVSALDKGGVEKMLQNYQSRMSEEIIFDFVTHRDNGPTGKWFQDRGSRIYKTAARRKHPIVSAIQAFGIIRKNHYNVVWLHGGVEICPELLACVLAGARIRFVHAHECRSADTFMGRISGWTIKFFTDKFASCRLACSRKAGELQYGEKPFRIIYNAIDLERYSFDPHKRDRVRNNLNLGERLTVGHIGRCVPEKNQIFLIEIFSEILKLQPDTVFIFVGDGKDKTQVLQAIDNYGLREHMIILNDYEDIPELMCAMDVFLLPSIREGLGLVLIEAQANGLACLASECVPEEARVTELLTIMESSASAGYWAEQAVAQGRRGHRPQIGSEMKESRYDIDKEAIYLMDWLRENCSVDEAG